MAKKYKPRTDAELRKEWDRLNGDKEWGMTFEEFQKAIKDGIEQYAKENQEFSKFIRRV